MLWSQNSPVDESHDEWICNRSIVEDAEECTIFGRGVLAGWREDLLEPSGVCLDLVGVMGVVKVHEGPHLRRWLMHDASFQEEVLTNASHA